MKRKLFFIAVIVICLSLTAYGTLAYYTAEQTAHNVITTGNVKIVLNDKIEGGEKTENGWSIDGVMPSNSVKKIVSVTNTGKADAWVRLKVDLTITAADGKEQLPTKMELSGADSVIDLVSYALGTDWVKGTDDFIYYTKILKKGETTPSLFQGDLVNFAKEMDNMYQNCKVTITISAQAVQSDNNAATYDQVAGWPTT